MTNQPTATERTTDPGAREDAGSTQQMTEPAGGDAQTEQATGTRELRDAQSRGANRPPIRAKGADGRGDSKPNAPLFDDASGKRLRERWMTIQTEFVDEPRDAVQKADSLVAEVLKQLTDTFANEREQLESAWSRSEGDGKEEVSTEDLRQAIRRYRSFFDRLLSL